MQWLELTLPDAAANLALDEALLLAAEMDGSGPVLRVWELAATAVVVGAGGVIDEEVDVAACQADGVPILRRSSGGGTVLLGPGCLCFSLVLPYDHAAGLHDLRLSYRYILQRVADALSPEVHAGPAGLSDLAVHGRKVSGNSQHRKRQHFLHHGTLLYAADLSRYRRYLPEPRRQPEYRQGRSHEEFLANLPLDASELRRRLRRVWAAAEPYLSPPWRYVESLMQEKYGRPAWHYHRRTSAESSPS